MVSTSWVSISGMSSGLDLASAHSRYSSPMSIALLMRLGFMAKSMEPAIRVQSKFSKYSAAILLFFLADVAVFHGVWFVLVLGTT